MKEPNQLSDFTIISYQRQKIILDNPAEKITQILFEIGVMEVLGHTWVPSLHITRI